MAQTPTLFFQAQGPPESTCRDFLEARRKRNTKAATTTTDEAGSALLQSIRAALRGSSRPGAIPVTQVHATGPVHQTKYSRQDGSNIEEELAWDEDTVCWSRSGLIRRYWDFSNTGESVRWACMGRLERQVVDPYHPTRGSISASNPTLSNPTSTSSAKPVRTTFGPFFQHAAAYDKASERSQLTECVFVFLRTSLRVFSLDGTDYTVSLPFLVRQAWPLWPHSVLIQRQIDARELDEAEHSGEELLPSLFTLTSPFAELSAVNIASELVHNPAKPDHWTVPQRDFDAMLDSSVTLPATETVVGLNSHWAAEGSSKIIATVDRTSCQLSIWQYAYVIPESTTTTAPSSQHGPNGTSTGVRTVEQAGKRPAAPAAISPDNGVNTAASTSRPSSTIQDMNMDNIGSTEPSGRSSAASQTSPVSEDMPPDVLDDFDFDQVSPALWMHRIHVEDISQVEAEIVDQAVMRLFDERLDSSGYRCYLAICFQVTARLVILDLRVGSNKQPVVHWRTQLSAVSIARVLCTRTFVYDLLVVRPDASTSLFTFAMMEVPLQFTSSISYRPSDVAKMPHSIVGVESFGDDAGAGATVTFVDKSQGKVNFNLALNAGLVAPIMVALSMTLPSEAFFHLLITYIVHRQRTSLSLHEKTDLMCFRHALADVFHLPSLVLAAPATMVLEDPWVQMQRSSKAWSRFEDDPALQHLDFTPPTMPVRPPANTTPPHPMLAPTLSTLHVWLEEQRLSLANEHAVMQVAPLICDIAMVIKPEWADHWKRLVPDAMATWHSPHRADVAAIDDRLDLWPIDLSASLLQRLQAPDVQLPPHGRDLGSHWKLEASCAQGKMESLPALAYLSRLYLTFTNPKVKNTRNRATRGIAEMVRLRPWEDFSDLPLGVAMPLLEGVRTMQLVSFIDWSYDGYKLIKRDDLAENLRPWSKAASEASYMSIKQTLRTLNDRVIYQPLIKSIRNTASRETSLVSGVELGHSGIAEACFGADRRLEEVARMLSSSSLQIAKMLERPDASELEIARDQQHMHARVMERTMAAPYGRGMLTFATVPALSQESFSIPKMDLSVRLMPYNVLLTTDQHKPHRESSDWSEFHNGVAAGLRITPSSQMVANSWIAFNKPTDLTPQHAGFLMALGLTGHLKEMLTWQTFGYLTPKHDFTSIGVLLGLSAAHVGTGNDHVTKLLAVHAPALLPHQDVDLNVPLVTQSAALAGLGLLYMATKKRHMAEVLLHEIHRRDLAQPDLVNEHREAYTLASGISFGMVMLGKGTNVPTDNDMVERLRILIHGPSPPSTEAGSFDLNLTSPAATIALGLMYLRTGRVDIANVLAVPEAIIELHRLQPAFLMTRTLAKALVMWSTIEASNEWLSGQVPPLLVKAMDAHLKTGSTLDDTLALAYYYIITGACFALALKFAGSNSVPAVTMLTLQYDAYMNLMMKQGTAAFDHRVRRSVLREGLNLIGICMSMVVAGSGELNCLQRLRAAYAQHIQPIRYGTYMATHLGIGLLFLGGGRYTLGTSDAAIACMIAAFYPRFNLSSADNKSYLQALRHLWVLAAEPRLLVTRDVDTQEVVNVYAKILKQDSPSAQPEMLHVYAPKMMPDIDSIKAIKLESPRYWPVYLDISKHPHLHASILRSQTVWIKRRSAFLPYMDDRKGARSLMVRSPSTTANAAALEVPTSANTDPEEDLNVMPLLPLYTTDPLFLATADHLCEDEEDATEAERVFSTFCRAALLDALCQDKSHVLQAHLQLFRIRTMPMCSRSFLLRAQDVRFCSAFYHTVFEERFSGRPENNFRPALMRLGTIAGTFLDLDRRFDSIREHPAFLRALGNYVRGEAVEISGELLPGGVTPDRALSWYLLRESVPPVTILLALRSLSEAARAQCSQGEGVNGTQDMDVLEQSIRRVIHDASIRLTGRNGIWGERSLQEVVALWGEST